jgi:pimeloyl-ACP methyl ester carboxylesterase
MTRLAEDRFFDLGGLTLHGRLYRGGAKTPAICLPGLTRNERDFSDVAPFLATSGRDVLALSFRGRALSSYDPQYLNYWPPTYVGDVLSVLDALAWPRAVFVGTSLGGIVTMLTNVKAPERVAAAVINDVGPELAREGVQRIAGYVGGPLPSAQSLEDAAAEIRAINEVAFPGRDVGFWRRFAERTFRRTETGLWTLDYDPLIGKALLEAGPSPELWPAFQSLNARPTLLVRGALSDLLSPEIVDKMRKVHRHFAFAEIPDVGHAPTLSEPQSVAALRRFLQSFDG